MKKWAGFLVFACFLFQGASFVWAVQRDTPEYEKMKEYKKWKRDNKGKPELQDQGPNFWQREASRSGLAGTAAMFGSALTNAIPLDKPNSRKQTN